MTGINLQITDRDGDEVEFSKFAGGVEGVVCSVGVKTDDETFEYVYIEEGAIDDVIEFLSIRRAEYHRHLREKKEPTLPYRPLTAQDGIPG